MITVAPCKDCADRHLGCHSECEKYKEFREFKEMFYKKRIKEQEMTDYVSDSIRRYARHKNTNRRNGR